MLPRLWHRTPQWICRAATMMCNLQGMCICVCVCVYSTCVCVYERKRGQWRRIFSWNDPILLNLIAREQLIYTEWRRAENRQTELPWIKEHRTSQPYPTKAILSACVYSVYMCICVRLSTVSASSTCRWFDALRLGVPLGSPTYARIYSVYK